MMTPGERAALFIAPPLAPIVLVTVISFPNYMGDFISSMQIVALFGVPIAYVIALCFGLPLYILARNHRWVNFWSLSLGGAVVADLPALITLFFLYDKWEGGKEWKLHATFGITGFVVGAVFWCVLHYWPHITLRSSGTAQKRAAP